MKQFLLILFLLSALIKMFGQAPGKFNYQAVARNTSGNLIISQPVSIKISILTGSTSGSSEYTENQSATTDAYGVFNILIGGGTVVSGSFDAISWGTASKFLKIEADVTGGTAYQTLATTQILSVPYAMYANQSGTKTFNDSEFKVIYANGIADNPTTSPTAILGGMGAGSVDNGTHDYKVTYITSAGETAASPTSISVTVTNNSANGKIFLSSIPVSGKMNVTARSIYRRFNTTGNYNLVTTITDNVTTSFIDNIANTSLGKVLPSSNGTMNGFQFSASGLTANQSFTLPDRSGSIVVDATTSVPVKDVANRSIILHGRTVIQQLINSNVSLGINSGEFGEAYVDADGRNNSVSYTTSHFDAVNKKYTGQCVDFTGDVNYNPNGFSGATNAFDKDVNTSASLATEGTTYESQNSSFGKSLGSAKFISSIYIKISGSVGNGSVLYSSSGNINLVTSAGTINLVSFSGNISNPMGGAFDGYIPINTSLTGNIIITFNITGGGGEHWN